MVDRRPQTPLPDEFPVPVKFVGLQGTVILRVELNARHSEDSCQQEFGIQAGALDAALAEEVLSRLQDLEDRPGP